MPWWLAGPGPIGDATGAAAGSELWSPVPIPTDAPAPMPGIPGIDGGPGIGGGAGGDAATAGGA